MACDEGRHASPGVWGVSSGSFLTSEESGVREVAGEGWRVNG